MDDSITQLVGEAEVNDFLATLAYRFSRERLKAMGRAHGASDAASEVLFVGLGDSGRGQIASALVTLRSEGRVVAHSAGADDGAIGRSGRDRGHARAGRGPLGGLRKAALAGGAGRGGRRRDHGAERRVGGYPRQHAPRGLARRRPNGSVAGRGPTRSRRHRSPGAGSPREPRRRDHADSRAGLAAGSGRRPDRTREHRRRGPWPRRRAPRRPTSRAPPRGSIGVSPSPRSTRRGSLHRSVRRTVVRRRGPPRFGPRENNSVSTSR